MASVPYNARCLRLIYSNKVGKLYLNEGQSYNYIRYLVMPFMNAGNALDLALNMSSLNVRMSRNACRWLFKQLVEAIAHLHEYQIAHMDLKLENVLLDRDGNVKLADFGLALEDKLCN